MPRAASRRGHAVVGELVVRRADDPAAAQGRDARGAQDAAHRAGHEDVARLRRGPRRARATAAPVRVAAAVGARRVGVADPQPRALGGEQARDRARRPCPPPARRRAAPSRSSRRRSPPPRPPGWRRRRRGPSAARGRRPSRAASASAEHVGRVTPQRRHVGDRRADVLGRVVRARRTGRSPRRRRARGRRSAGARGSPAITAFPPPTGRPAAAAFSAIALGEPQGVDRAHAPLA